MRKIIIAGSRRKVRPRRDTSVKFIVVENESSSLATLADFRPYIESFTDIRVTIVYYNTSSDKYP